MIRKIEFIKHLLKFLYHSFAFGLFVGSTSLGLFSFVFGIQIFVAFSLLIMYQFISSFYIPHLYLILSLSETSFPLLMSLDREVTNFDTLFICCFCISSFVLSLLNDNSSCQWTLIFIASTVQSSILSHILSIYSGVLLGDIVFSIVMKM